MTIREWLIATFGEDAPGRIAGADLLGGAEMGQARLCSTEGTAALQSSCGGDCLIAFERADGMRGRYYLIRRDREGERWDAHRRAGADSVQLRDLTGSVSRPHARLELIMSM